MRPREWLDFWRITERRRSVDPAFEAYVLDQLQLWPAWWPWKWWHK